MITAPMPRVRQRSAPEPGRGEAGKFQSSVCCSAEARGDTGAGECGCWEDVADVDAEVSASAGIQFEGI